MSFKTYRAGEPLKPEFFHFGDDGKLYMVIALPEGGMADVEIDIRLVSFVAAKAISNKTGRSGEGGGMVRARRRGKPSIKGA